MVTNFFKTCAFFLFFLLFQAAAHAENNYTAKIAVVDVEFVLENSLAITNVRDSINILGENIQNEIYEQEKKLKEREEELLKLQKTLNEKSFQDLVEKFDKDLNVVKKNFKLKKMALEQAHLQAIEEVHVRLISIISEFAKKRNLNIILPSSQVLYTTNELNVTLEIISQLNDSLKEMPVNYQKFLQEQGYSEFSKTKK